MSASKVHVIWPSEIGQSFLRRFDLDYQIFEQSDLQVRFTKMMCTAPEPELLQAIFAETDQLPLERCFSLPNVLEFTAAGINKGQSLVNLLNDHTILRVIIIKLLLPETARMISRCSTWPLCPSPRMEVRRMSVLKLIM